MQCRSSAALEPEAPAALPGALGKGPACSVARVQSLQNNVGGGADGVLASDGNWTPVANQQQLAYCRGSG